MKAQEVFLRRRSIGIKPGFAVSWTDPAGSKQFVSLIGNFRLANLRSRVGAVAQIRETYENPIRIEIPRQACQRLIRK